MFRYKQFFYVTIFSIQLALQAGENSSALSRQNAVDLALANNRELRAATEVIEQARARSRYAGRLDNPSLEFGASSDRLSQNEGAYGLSLGFSQNFPITNRLSLLKGIAAIEVELAKAEVESRKRQLATEVERVIVELAETDGQLKLRRKLVKLNQRFVKFIESRIEMGEASTIESNQLRVGLYALKQEIQQLEGQRIEQCAKLCELIGSEVEMHQEVQFRLALPEQAPELPPMSMEALQEHPEYQLKRQLREMASKHTELQRAKRWADITFSLSVDHEREADEPRGFESEQMVGFEVSVPLPLHDKNRGEIEASQSLERQMAAEMAALEWRLRNAAALESEKVRRYYIR